VSSAAHHSDEAEAVAAKVERILKVAKLAFFGAIDLCSCIEILEAGNQPDVIQSIRDAKASHAADLINKALFQRLVMDVMTPLGPEREPGDVHLRVGMELIAEEAPRQTILLRGGNLDEIQAAERRWAECLEYEPLKRLKTYRNKVAAHLSELPPDIGEPIINELFTLARMIAEVGERLAHGTGVAAVSLQSQVSPFRDSARAFWGIWKTKDASAPKAIEAALKG
jgi:hypothetical protein